MIRAGFALLICLAVITPAAATSGPVEGEGPGGSGAFQSRLGPSKGFALRHAKPVRHHRHHHR